MSDNQPVWLNDGSVPPPSQSDREAMEIFNLGIKGLIALKRLFMSPAGTKNEIDAATEVAEIIKQIFEKLPNVGH